VPARPAALATPAVTPEADRASLGRHLRENRKAQQLTLKDLSARSGVALSTLSKMELGQVAVSYEKLAAVARALALDVGQLFGAQPSAAAGGGARQGSPVVWTSAQASPAYSSGHYEYQLLATGYAGRRMSPLYARIVARPPDAAPEFIHHAGQEFVMVLSGRVRITFETGEVIELGRHESAYFDSGVGHVYGSLGRTAAQVVVVMSEEPGHLP
jgi:transcriptional regulator with XRE-family HTH domain